MGEVEIVESGSLDGLTNGWEQYGKRTRILMLGARADRAALRGHGRSVAIEESAVSVFHRPRKERAEMEAEGIDHKSTSFQFVDLSMVDLGRWLQPLMGQGWTRNEVTVTASSDASFEDETWTCFHHPSIAPPTRMPLIESPSTMMRKAFVTHPGPILEEFSASVVEEEMHESMLETIKQSMDVEEETEPEVEVAPEPEEPEVEPEPKAEPIPLDDDDIPPIPKPKEESPLEAELRQVISLLVAGGQEMSSIMEHPQFIEVSERASAAGVDVWGMFVKLSENN
ncbi:MAG: hypothetical protein QGF94_00945 [Candidatus Thalassarchaeaceae archaeon]|jgi:hypothetical protein|nr:hypothetical protein [Candidatus Thalassarchaeaceae archaeon]